MVPADSHIPKHTVHCSLFYRVTCSHVGHIYRGPRRKSMHPKNASLFQSHINHLRVADVRICSSSLVEEKTKAFLCVDLDG